MSRGGVYENRKGGQAVGCLGGFLLVFLPKREGVIRGVRLSVYKERPRRGVRLMLQAAPTTGCVYWRRPRGKHATEVPWLLGLVVQEHAREIGLRRGQWKGVWVKCWYTGRKV